MRLIDADALRNEYCRECLPDKAYDCRFDPWCGTMMWVNEAPTIDAVPVVRCAECKWFDKGGNGVAPICARHSGLAGAHDRSFCSYGEKRDEEDKGEC